MGKILFLAAVCLSHAAAYQLTLSGPSSIYAGSDVYIVATVTFRGDQGHVYISPPSLPAGAAVAEYRCGWNIQVTCTKTTGYPAYVYVQPSEAKVVFGLRVSGLPAGRHTIPVRVTVKGADSQTAAYAVSVDPLPPIHSRYQRWHDAMLKLAPKWCNPDERFSFGVESQVWYYDGARVLFQVADYTGDSRYEACALNVARQYRDYVLAHKGAIPGWRVFTRGLRMAYTRTADESFRAAVNALASGTFGTMGGSPFTGSIRETAYALNAYVDAELLGAPRHKLMGRAVDYLLGDFNALFVQGAYELHQTCFDGIAAEALIHYYELTGDRRVIAAVRTMADWMITHAIRADGLIVNPEPKGDKCDWGCQSANKDLINLTSPAFAWLWSVTHDERYRDAADALFAQALDDDISYSGKIFSQNYKWTFDFLRWRQ